MTLQERHSLGDVKGLCTQKEKCPHCRKPSDAWAHISLHHATCECLRLHWLTPENPMVQFSGQGDFSLILDKFMSELRGCVHVLALCDVPR